MATTYHEVAERAVAAARAELEPGEELPLHKEIGISVSAIAKEYYSGEIAHLQTDLHDALDILERQQRELGELRPLAADAATLDDVRQEMVRVTRRNARLTDREQELLQQLETCEAALGELRRTSARERGELQKRVRQLERATRERLEAKTRADADAGRSG